MSCIIVADIFLGAFDRASSFGAGLDNPVCHPSEKQNKQTNSNKSLPLRGLEQMIFHAFHFKKFLKLIIDIAPSTEIFEKTGYSSCLGLF